MMRPGRIGSRTELISSDSIDRALSAAIAHAAGLVAAYPRSLPTAAVMLALTGFGATAFGTSQLALDENAPKQRIVSEDVTPGSNSVQSQLDALAEHELQLYRTDLTRPTDTADSLLARLNVSDVNAAVFLRANPTARQLLSGPGGKMVRVQTDETGKL